LQSENHRFSAVRALVFDLDGTLIDSAEDLALAVNAAIRHLGRPPLAHQDIFSYVGHGAPALIRRALGQSPTEAEASAGLKFFLDYYREHMLDHTAPYPGVRESLEALASYSMAVLTNKPVGFSRRILEGLGLARHFQHVFGGESFERKKPDPMGMQALLLDFKAAPSEAMMIGDSDVDIQTARNAGTWACGVTYGLGSATLRNTAPDLLLDSLSGLKEWLKL
jgi:phosphoglycolate phosphatase